MPNRLRGRASLLLAALGTLAIAFPLGVLASHQFSDVPSDNPFHSNIDALVASGVTTGCGGGRYCPKDYVTREQMAAFLDRLGALATGRAPVVNADRLDGISSEGFLKADATEPWRVVGQPGQPAFGPAVNDCDAATGNDPSVCEPWANFDPNAQDWSTAAFYRDPVGTVHLRGVVTNPGTGSFRNRTIFVLPATYRPSQPMTLGVVTYDGGGSSGGNVAHLFGSVYIETDGRVLFARAGGSWLSLDGITFRAP